MEAATEGVENIWT